MEQFTKLNIPKSEYYVLKKLNIPKSECNNFYKIIKNTNKKLYKIIYFNKFINKINDSHFDKLYSYKILKDNFKYNYYLKIITDLKDDTLYSMCKNKKWNNKNEFYSMVIQIIYALYLMHSYDFYHADLHWNNIMYSKTNIKSIKILNFNVPTYGYIWTIINYSDIESHRFKYNDKDRKFLFIFRNLAYEDLMSFYHDAICSNNFNICKKIIKNIKLSYIEIKKYFGSIKYYKDAENFYEYAVNNDHIKITPKMLNMINI